MSVSTRIAGRLAGYSRERLSTFWRLAKVELRPPTPGDLPAIQKGFSNVVSGFKNGKWRELTVKEAWINSLITMEVMFWFFAGEVIGRRHFRGYYIPPE